MPNEIQTVSAEIAALENELREDSSSLSQDYTQPPKLELYADKVKNKGLFTFGVGDDKMELGDEVDVIFMSRGSEIRSVMEEGADTPRCFAVDGVPKMRPDWGPPLAPSCAGCIYNTWVNDKPYADESGNKCRARKHIPVEVIVDADGERRMSPAILVVPPTSLRFERQYRGSLAGTARLKGGASILSVVTRLATSFVNDKYKYATMRFEPLGRIADYLKNDQDYLTFLTDKKAVLDAISSGASNANENHDDITSQKVQESRGGAGPILAGADDVSEDESELPF